MMKTLIRSACLAAGLLASGVTAQAAVSVLSTATQNTAGGTASSFTFPGFSLGSGNALVVVITGEVTGAAPTVTFNGDSVTNKLTRAQAPQFVNIFWAINPASTSGDVVVSLGATGDAAVSVMALGGVQGVAYTNSFASTGNGPYVIGYDGTNTAGGLVVAGLVDNAFGGTPLPTITGGNVTTYLQQLLWNFRAAASSAGMAQAYGNIPANGTNTVTFARSGTGNSTRNAGGLVAFSGISLDPVFWKAGSGVWDINTTANWTNNIGPTNYVEVAGVGSPVVFEDAFSGASPITVTLNASVVPSVVTVSNSTKNYTISGSGSINGSAALIKTGNGMLTLGTVNTYSGGSTLNGGTTVFSTLDNLGTGSLSFGGGTLKYNGNTDDLSVRTVTIAAGGATIDTSGQSVSFNNPVGNNGAGGLTKTGAGELFLSGGNRYAGDTVVSSGTLGLTGGSAILSNSPSIILSSGTTFDTVNNGGYTLQASVSQTLTGVGSVNGDLTVPVGARISPATTNTTGTLVFSNNLTVNGTLELNVSTTSKDQLLIGNTLTINPGAVLIVHANALTNGLYKLMQADFGIAGTVGNFTFNYNQAGKSADLVVVIDGSTNTIYLEIADLSSDTIIWSGAGADWDQVGTLNWFLGVSTPWAFTNGATTRFNETGIANANVNLQDVLKPSLIVVSNSTDYTFSDGTGVGGGKVSGTARLLKQSSGRLTINTVNDNTGGTTIEGGTVDVYGQISSGPVTNNASLNFLQTEARSVNAIAGSGHLTQTGAGALTVTGAATYTGSTTLGSGATLQVGNGGATGAMTTSAITNDGTLILNSSANWNYTMSDTGTGNLRKQGTNIVTLSGANSRTGETRVDSGKLVLGNANQLKGTARLEGTGTLDLNGNNQLVLNATGAGGLIVNNAGMATNIFTVSNSVAGDSSAIVQDNQGTGGAVAFVKQGAGELNWRGANTYSGGSTIEEGTVRATSASLFGTGPVNMKGGAINFSANSTFGNTIHLLPPIGSTTNTFYPRANVFSGAPLVGTSDLIIDFGSAGATFSMNGGATKWAGLTNTTYLRATAAGWLRFDSGSDARNVTFDLSDSFAQINANGVQTIHLGGLLGNANTAAVGDSEACTVFVGNKNLNTTFAGQLGGNFSWVKVGSGTQTLSGTNTTTGSLTVSNGTLALALDAAPANMNTITVVSNATLNVSALADHIIETNELGEVTNSFYVTNATLALGGSAVAQTLRGGGTINGNVVIGTNATVAPGLGILTLTVNNALTLNGTATLELNRTNSQTADRINAGSYTGTGTINVTNLGPDLVTGDTFQLFGGAVSGLTVNLPVSNALNTIAYAWTNKLAIDGTIQLLSGASAVNTTPTNIVSSVAGGNLTLSWPAGHTGWTLQVQTNSRAVGLNTNWFAVDGSSATNQATLPIGLGNGAVFYRLVYP
jgi:fibronectin-binding autotransporter adhesin